VENGKMSEAAKKKHPSPRLSVLLASEAPVGVVFRRGPTKLVRAILWDRSTDEFEPGQWFQGKIYADRSDLSPDGRHMIYFAMGGVAWGIRATEGTWTAISPAPSLTAIALWGQGDTRGGGGMFTSNRTYWLNADANTFLIRDDGSLRRDSKRPAATKLERDGWVSRGLAGRYKAFEKNLPLKWILRRLTKYHDDGYELEKPEDHCKLQFAEWEWAEWDRKRLVWVESGCIRTAPLGSHKLGAVRTLYDFNDMKFEK
jgi:hypothetical protein